MTTTEMPVEAAHGQVPEVRQPPKPGKISDRFAYGLVALSVGFGFWSLRGERLPVAYLNDSSVHELSVAYARLQWASGHFPFDGWFPYLSLGSPFFMHYQSTPAVLTGLLALAIGSANAFSWSLYVLLAAWPISVYFSARLFMLHRWQAAAAAAVAPLIMSITGYGYEHQSYDWLGNGLWPQLWGMWMLPLAWAFSWQAISKRRHRLAAVLTLAGTIAFHFLTAYLAGLMLIVWVVIRPLEIVRRVGRAAVIGVAALAATLWITVPVVVYGKWGSFNEFQVHTFWDDSYGARKILSWLVRGELYDYGRFPIVTILAAIGMAVCLWRFRRDERARALVGAWVLSMCLYFGRPTLGFLWNRLPDQQDILFQRYNSGVDLAGILLAGVGLAAVGQIAVELVRRYGGRFRSELRPRMASLALPALAVVLVVAGLYPAWTEINTRGNLDAAGIAYQRTVDAQAGSQLNVLLSIVTSANDGRVYAGLPANGGNTFRLNFVPIYIYLADQGMDAVGFTLRTQSLMSGPEAYFDDANFGDYSLFGIHYQVLPVGDKPLVSAKLVARDGPFALWSIGSGGYFQVVDTQGTLTETSSDVGTVTASLLRSELPSEHVLPTVSYEGATAASPTLSAGEHPSGSPGSVLSSKADLVEGKASAVVRMNRRAVVLLSESFDPGWQVTVDGRPAKAEMVAPALVGVTVGPGVHTVAFHYAAFAYYPELFAAGAVAALVAVLAFTRLGDPIRRRRRSAKAA